jgi:hypothetical protein
MRVALAEEGWLADPAVKLSAESAAELEDPTSHAAALADIERALRKAIDSGHL